MVGYKVHHAISIFMVLLLSAIFITSCSMQDLSDTIGSCCGASALPMGAVGLVLLARLNEKDRS